MNAGEREGLRRLLERLDLDHAQFAGRGSLFGDAADALRGLLDALEAAEAERDDLRDLMQRQNLMIATTEVRAEEAERKVAAVEALPETSGWIAYDGVKDRSVIYVADLRAALAAEDTAELPPRAHRNGSRSDSGPESGRRDHRDDEGRSGAQEEGK